MDRKDSIYWIGTAFIISALIVVSSYFFIRFEIAKTRRTKGVELESIARLKSGQVASWLLDEKQDAAVIAQNVLLIEKVRHFLKDSSLRNEKEIITYFQSVIKEHGFEHVLLTDTAGTIMTTSVGNDYSTDPYLFNKIKQTIHSRSVTTTDIYNCSVHDTMHIDFIAPIVDTEQNILGAIVFQHNPYHFLFPLIQYWPTLSKSSETLLYKIIGDSILFLNELKLKKNTALKFTIPLSAKDVVAVKAANSPDGIIEGIDYSGNKVFAYVVKVPQTDWIMVSKTDKKDLFSVLYFETGIIILLVVFLLLFLGTGMAYLYNRRQKNVFRDLYKSQENYHTTLKSIGDAVISTNKQGKVEYLNSVAKKLTGWSMKEAIGKNLEEVFRIINEETRNIVESPVNKVLREGLVVGLANHTLLISKDGMEIPIADSGAPIKNERGEITGVVLVFRDQTEEREYQKKIARSEAQYRELIESTDAIAWEYDILIDKWVYVAPQVSDQLGWLPEEWTNLDFWKNNIHPDEREESTNYCLTCTARGEPHTLEYRFKKKNGDYVWLRDVVAVEIKENKPVKIRGVMFDITERKESEIALQRSNKNWETLTEATRILNSELEPEIILRQLVASAIELTGANEGTAGLLIDGKMVFKEYNAHGNILPVDYSFEEGYGAPGHVLKTKKAYLSNNAENDKHVISEIRQKLGFYNLIDTPIIDRHGDVLGCFELHNKPSGFDDYDLILLQNLAAGTAIALENSNIVEQLQQSEERFRKAILLAPIPIMVHCQDGKVINVSEGWTNFSGYNIKDIPTMKAWAEKAYGEKAREIEEYVNGLFIEDKTVFSGEFEIKTKSGEKRIWNFHTTPLGKLKDGNKIMLSMAPDITQRKRIQNELEESERAYRHLFENHTAVKLLIDTETGQIVKANQAAADFYGWSIEKLQSMNIGEINTLSQEKIREAMEFARTLKKVSFEFKHRLANGQVRDVEVSANPIEYGGNELLHSIVHDVTDKKRLLDDLITAKEKAEESDRLKTAFLANMSHEIRTPMNGILGFTELLKDPFRTGDEQQHYISVIEKSGERMLNIINDIISISKIEVAEIEILTKEMQVNKVMEEIYDFFRPEAEEKNLQLDFKNELDDKDLIIYTDREKVYAILTNLVKNAIKFTHEGAVQIGCVKKGQFLQYYVKDTGIGISEKHRKIIFERFRQVSESFTRNYEGAGLGLSISKAYIEKLGGSIWVESEEGNGSAFYFTIPCNVGIKNETHEKNSMTKTIVNIPNQKLKILIVEDDKGSSDYLAAILKNRSGQILTAETGMEAVELFKKDSSIDLILMDIRMPHMNGYEATSEIRKWNDKVIIIAQTAFAMSGDEEKAIKVGCNDYITKPIKKEQLFVLINKYFGPYA